MSNVNYRDNGHGTVIKTVVKNGVEEKYAYDILVGGNIPAGDSILDYCYSQHEENLTNALKTKGFPTNKFCSGTCAAMILAINYGDKKITPLSVLLWGDETNPDNCKYNWNNGLIEWEQDEYEKADKQVYDNRDTNTGTYGAIDGSRITTEEEYLKNLKIYLSEGLPVIIEVNDHYLVVVGVESNIKLEEATLDQLVVFDPNWTKDISEERKIVTFKQSNHYKVSNRLLTPYPIVDNPNPGNNEESGEDENGQEIQSLVTPDNTKLFVADENGNKTHDPYYIDPVRKSDESIIPAKQGRTLKKAIEAVNNSTMTEDEKAEKIEGLIKLFTGEDDDVVYKNLTASKNGEYLPEEGVTAFDKVTVNIPIAALGVSENGIYYAAERSVAGFDPVNVNVPDRYEEGYLKGFADAADKIKKAEELETDGGTPIDVPEDDDKGGGTYHFAEGAVTGLSEETAGYVARQFKGGGYLTDIAHGKIIKIGTEYDEERSYNEWHLILELYDARTGELIQNGSGYWADCRNWTGSAGNDDLRLSNVEASSGFYTVVSADWYKYKAPTGYARSTHKYVRWGNDGVSPQYVVSKTMPTYTASE